jgi:hypothetical protein
MNFRSLMPTRAKSVMLVGALLLPASACEDPDDILPTPPGDATVTTSEAGDAKSSDVNVEATLEGSINHDDSSPDSGSADSGWADADLDGNASAP